MKQGGPPRGSALSMHVERQSISAGTVNSMPKLSLIPPPKTSLFASRIVRH